MLWRAAPEAAWTRALPAPGTWLGSAGRGPTPRASIMRRETRRATLRASIVTAVLGALIVVGSRNLAHFDAALVAYTFAILFATFGVTYRYAMWLERPPTRRYWARTWQALGSGALRPRHLGRWAQRSVSEVLGNRFIFRRGTLRGLTHLLIMWGCIIAVLITFPLVFGWIHFRTVPGELSTYEAVLFGFPAFRFPYESAPGFFLFHGLVWSSFLVIGGVMLAMRRRMREEGAAAVQRFTEDMMPLFLLFAISITGLMMTASYTWMEGYAYTFIATLHAVTVIGTFIWVPFGKFFHIFQRPAQLGVGLYQDLASEGEPARCRRCGHAFTSRMHVEDLIRVERELGYRYEVSDRELGHYQWICPPCRRASFAMAQAALWRGRRGGAPIESDGRPIPMPRYANPGAGEGPLGSHDAENFHP